jgi:ferritin-like metal-binding protein YciE
MVKHTTGGQPTAMSGDGGVLRDGPSRDLLVAWLRDAHAMEKGLIPVLENHAKDAKRHPLVRERVERHAEETRRHADLIEGCLERLGEKPSTMKSAIGGIMGSIQSISTGAAKDEEVKNALADYATEHFEIACYRALVEGARALRDEDTARTCEQILEQELDMARFLEQNLPTTVRDALATAA